MSKSCLMEEKKSTLPSNYVTLVQLQERWLKQQQSKIIQQQPPNQNHRQDQKLIAPIDGNAYSSQPQKPYVVKNRSDSEDDKRKLEIAAGGIGDETADLSGKVSESKNRKWKLKRKTEKRGASGEGSGTAAQGSEEGKKKATSEKDLKDEKIEMKEEAEQSARVSPVEQRVRVLTVKSGNGKQNERFGKKSNGVPHYRSQRKKHYGEAHGIEEAEKKATIENELNEENNGGSVTAEEVVNRSVRVLTNNSGNLGKTSHDFGHSQSQRKHYVEAQGNEDAEKRATIDNQLKEKKKNVGSVTLEEAEERVRVLTVKSGNGKHNERFGKKSNGVRHYRSQRKKHYGEAHGIEEGEKKATIENELNEENNGGSVTAEEVVNRSVRVLTNNSGNLGKTSNDFGHSQSQRKHYVEAQGNEDAEKRVTIDNQLKEKKKNVGSVTLEEAEERVRVLSINSGDVEQNKMKNGFRQSQPRRRKHYGGEASRGYGYGYRNLQHYSKVGVQRREKKMVWVKKDEIVG